MSRPSLEERLQRLEDREAIRELLHAYGPALDYGDEDAYVDCYTCDGVFERRILEAAESPGGHNPTQTFRGHAELRAFAEAHSRAPERRHKHVVTGTSIDVAGGAASAESYFIRFDDAAGERVIFAFGRYLDQLVRSADGRWRFSHRIAEVEARDARPSPPG